MNQGTPKATPNTLGELFNDLPQAALLWEDLGKASDAVVQVIETARRPTQTILGLWEWSPWTPPWQKSENAERDKALEASEP